jgi:hypothetical protein
MMGVGLVLVGYMVVQYRSDEGRQCLWGDMPSEQEGDGFRSSQFHLVEEALGFCWKGENMWFSTCQ